MMKGEIGVIILAGGKSERMIFPKAYLLCEGKTFLKKIVDEYYNAGVENSCVVLNEAFCTGEWENYVVEVKSTSKIIKNPNPDLGRIHSLKLGIKEMQDLEFCFIQNIDNPLVNIEVIKSLIEAKNSEGYSAPVFKGRSGHPILISKKLMQHINNLPEGDFNLKNVLSGFPKTEVQINNEDILININTVEDYKKQIAPPNFPEREENQRTSQTNGSTGNSSSPPIGGRLGGAAIKQLRAWEKELHL